MNEASPHKKSLTFISRHPPYGQDNARTCLDLVLASSVFEQEVNFLFMGDGVYQLLAGQRPEGIETKNLLAALNALEIYGVEKVFVDQLSLQARNLSVDELGMKVNILSPEQAEILINSADQVFNL